MSVLAKGSQTQKSDANWDTKSFVGILAAPFRPAQSVMSLLSLSLVLELHTLVVLECQSFSQFHKY